MMVIGICALPAGGKSAVAAALQRCGAVWVDADRIAHEVLEIPEAREQIVRQFGSAIAGADGKIDRPRLGEIVFRDDAAARAALKYLEAVVHPLVRRSMINEIAAAMRKNAPAITLDVPLLFESQWDLWCDEIWFVDTPRSTRLAAAARRGWSAEKLDQRAANQLNAEQKRRLSSRTISNEGTLEQLTAQIEALWALLVPTDSGAVGPHCREPLLGAETP
jgi:dephospho-CoA kinase